MGRTDKEEERKPTTNLVELKKVEELMSFAIAREKASADYYLHAYEKATTEAARKAFSLLLEQERDHEKIMREQLAELRKEIERAHSAAEPKR